MGAVGKPLSNIELKFADDGELLVRGPSVFIGYWHKPSPTAECFDGDGWFRTGDIAHFDDDGFLYITDRKKELLKTSGGKAGRPSADRKQTQKLRDGRAVRARRRQAQVHLRADLS